MRQIGIEAAVFVVISFTACGPQKPPAGREVVLATLLPSTGALQANSVGILNGMNLGVEEINASGFLGQKLRLEIRDSRSTPEGARAAAEELASIVELPVLFGAHGSSETIGALEFTIPRGILTITGSATSTALTAWPDSDLFFRTVPTVTKLSKVMASTAHANGVRTTAILALTNAYSKSLADLYASEMTALGDTVAMRLDYPANTTSTYNYQADLDAVFGMRPDAIFLAGYPNDTIAYLKTWALRPDAFTGTWFLSDAVKSMDVVVNVGAARVEGIRGTSFAASDGPAGTSFKERYRARFNEDVPSRAAENYDATLVLALALAKAGTTDALAIRDALREVANPPGIKVGPGQLAEAFRLVSSGQDVDYEGAAGPIDFDANGDVEAPVESWAFENGTIVTKKIE